MDNLCLYVAAGPERDDDVSEGGTDRWGGRVGLGSREGS